MLKRYGWPMVSVLALTFIASLAGFSPFVSLPDQAVDSGYDYVAPDSSSDPVSASSYSSLHFIDVGQGDATLVIHGGRTVLIDGGPSRAGPDVVDYIRGEGVHWLDYVVATHPHADHVGGLYSVVTMIPIGQVIDSRVDYSSQVYGRLLSAITRMEVPYVVGTAGQELQLGSESRLSILWPPEQESGAHANVDVNDLSIVCMIEIAAIRILMLGDISASIERILIRNFGEDLVADVIKVAHHGSRTATSEELLLTVQPKLAIISVGKGNQYGHPAQEVLDRLAAAGIEVYRTDEWGSVVLYTDGRDIWVAADRDGKGL